MNCENNTSIYKTFYELLILHELQQQDMYGYELTQTINKHLGGYYNVSSLSSSLYPILYKFEKEQKVSSERRVFGKRLRVYYHLEPAGKIHLKQLKEDYKKTMYLLKNVING